MSFEIVWIKNVGFEEQRGPAKDYSRSFSESRKKGSASLTQKDSLFVVIVCKQIELPAAEEYAKHRIWKQDIRIQREIRIELEFGGFYPD